MHEVEIKELMKQVNGKIVTWSGETDWGPGVKFEAICLAPPDGKIVSIKPYGITPEELRDKMHKLGHYSVTLPEVSNPKFCFTLIRPFGGLEGSGSAQLKYLAELEEGADYDQAYNARTGKIERNFSDGSPVCPY